jgi:hypothetical protein
MAAPMSGTMGRDASAWTAATLAKDRGWVVTLCDEDRADLLAGLRSWQSSGLRMMDSRAADFPFGDRVVGRLRAAVDEAQHGRGVCLVRGLPRDGLDSEAFEGLTWGLGLHLGVARPQDRLTRYINAVRDVGVDYRSQTGRGYSSRAELDFHVDSGDVVLLSCYNAAKAGGESIISSGVTAWRRLVAERPDLARTLETEQVAFSRQGEQGPGERPFHLTTIFARTDSDVFCAWNRNRIQNGMRLEGAPTPSPAFLEGIERLEEILRRPSCLFRMWLEPGDLQILSNFTVLHSRTAFEDFDDEATKRTLFRLWLATPAGRRLPDGWGDKWGATAPGVIKGGIRGHHYDARCADFERRQAEALDMRLA